MLSGAMVSTSDFGPEKSRFESPRCCGLKIISLSFQYITVMPGISAILMRDALHLL